MATAVLSFNESINPATKRQEQRRAPFNGTLTEAHFIFPDGPSGLVEVRLLQTAGRSARQVLPTQDGSTFALNNQDLHLLDLDMPVVAGDSLIVERANYDGGFAHSIPVTLVVTEAKDGAADR